MVEKKGNFLGIPTQVVLATRPSIFNDTAYKASLAIDIDGVTEQNKATHYLVRVTKTAGADSRYYQTVLRRFNHFYNDLYVKLNAYGFDDMPELPPRKINFFMTAGQKKERSDQLQQYLRVLISRKDTRNTKEVIEFLELESFCPESLYNRPQLHVSQTFDKRLVTHCLFLSKYSIYILVISDKQKRPSLIKAFAFNQTGIISDQYVIRGSVTDRRSAVDSNGKEKPRTSVHEAVSSPDGSSGSFPSPSDTGRDNMLGKQRINQTTELMSESLPAHMTAISVCKDLDLIVCGMGDGSVIQFKVSIEQAPLFNNQNTPTLEENNMAAKINAIKSKPSTALLMFENSGNVLAYKYFWSSESDTPELDLENSTWTSAQQETKREPNDPLAAKTGPGSAVAQKQFLFKAETHSRFQGFSSKVKDMLIDQTLCQLYMCCEQCVSVIDLTVNRPTVLKALHSRNMRPVKMVLDEEIQWLYVGSKEGMLLILDTAHQNHLVMLHNMRLVANGSKNYIKQMDLDKSKNIIMCRMKPVSAIICIQLIQQNVRKSTVIEKVTTYSGDKFEKLAKTEQISKFKWLSRLSMYAEGTSRGTIKIRDILKQGEILMHVPLHAAELGNKVCMLDYDQEKNIMFASTQDGSFKLWKLHNEWRNKSAEKFEQKAFQQIRKEIENHVEPRKTMIKK